MRHGIIAAAAIFIVGFSSPSFGADVSEEGARDLRNTLTRFLPHDLADSGLLTVKPTSGRYEVTYDLTKLLDRIGTSNLIVAGLKPLSMFAEPTTKGLWNIDGDNAFDISAQSRSGDGPTTDVRYAIGSLVYSGVFDPAIGYMRSLDATARDFQLTSETSGQRLEAGASGMTYKLSSVDTAKQGTVDILSTGTMPDFHEKITGTAPGNADIKTGTVSFDAKATGVPIRELYALVNFVLDHAKAKKLSKRGSDRFEKLVRDALPLFVSLDETAVANDISVVTDVGTFALSKLAYSFRMNGLTEASSIGFGLRAENLKLETSAIPAGYQALVPDAAVLEVGIPDMNFAAAAHILLDSDFSTGEGISSEDSRKIEQAIFPSDRLTIDFPEISARSSVYDIDVSGKMTSNLLQTKEYGLQMSVLARDYDKTIAFVQNAAKADPELNQVSFVMMLAKGFAKTDPDGRQRWDVSVAEDGTFIVNGQVVTAPK